MKVTQMQETHITHVTKLNFKESKCKQQNVVKKEAK